MMKKICGRCGKTLSLNETCSCNKKAKAARDREYDRTQRKNHDIYNNPIWRALTEQCEAKFDGLDIYILYTQNKIVYGELSHHVDEVANNKERAYDISNLIYVSDRTHRIIHKAYNSSEEEKKRMQELLFELIKRWEKDYC